MAHQIRLTDKMNLLADARFTLLMERRKREGKDTVNPTTARSVMWALINRSDQDGKCDPSQRLIALESETNVRSVRRVVDLLSEETVIAVTERRYEAGADPHDKSHVYRIDWQTFAELCDGGRLVTCGQSGRRGVDGDADRLSPSSEDGMRTDCPHACGQSGLRDADSGPGGMRTIERGDADSGASSPTEIARRSSDPSDENHENENHLSADARDGMAEHLSEEEAAKRAEWCDDIKGRDFPMMACLSILEAFRLEGPVARECSAEFGKDRIIDAAVFVRKCLRNGQQVKNPTGMFLAVLRRRSRGAERTAAGNFASKIHQHRARRLAS